MSTQSERPTDEWLLVEGWGQGFMVGCLIVMVAVTVSNMRKGVLLHKLILTEVWSSYQPLMVHVYLVCM